MEGKIYPTSKQQSSIKDPEERLALDNMKFTQGLGMSLRFANEIRAVQQVGRLAPLKSSRLHEEVLKGKLGAGNLGWANYELDREL